MACYRVLFVCMGNICRSPAAEGVMRRLVEDSGLSDAIQCDSAGTIDYHAGASPDPRMREAASQRGIALEGEARRIRMSDFDRFDRIVVMDHENLNYVKDLDGTGKHAEKIKLFCEYVSEFDDQEVPDPYYGGLRGFEHVLDLLEEGCGNLLQDIVDGMRTLP